MHYTRGSPLNFFHCLSNTRFVMIMVPFIPFLSMAFKNDTIVLSNVKPTSAEQKSMNG